MVTYVCTLYSVKPVAEKAPLVIPLIHHNRWLSARKPEDLEAEDGDGHQTVVANVAAVEQTGDKVTDTAVREILNGNRKKQFLPAEFLNLC